MEEVTHKEKNAQIFKSHHVARLLEIHPHLDPVGYPISRADPSTPGEHLRNQSCLSSEPKSGGFGALVGAVIACW